MKLEYRWTNQQHILPSSAERSAAGTSAGFQGSAPQLFNTGNYAMVWSGRYLLVQLRLFDQARVRRGDPPLELSMSECLICRMNWQPLIDSDFGKKNGALVFAHPRVDWSGQSVFDIKGNPYENQCANGEGFGAGSNRLGDGCAG
jgi:hypothetical protein